MVRTSINSLNFGLNVMKDAKILDSLQEAAVEGVADFVHSAWDGMVKPTYPSDHEAGMRVPKGGSSCASCKYLEGKDKCNNKYFIKWNGSKNLPLPAEEFCSDWYEPADKSLNAYGTSEGVTKAWDTRGRGRTVPVRHIPLGK